MSKPTFEQFEPLIHKICNNHRKFAESRGIEYADLYQTGCVGLLEGIERYEPQHGVKPITYLYSYVNWRVYSEIVPQRERSRFKAGGPVVVYTDKQVTREVKDDLSRVDDAEEIDRVMAMFSDKDQQILRAYGEGHKPRALAKTFNCSRQNIHRVINNFRDSWQEING